MKKLKKEKKKKLQQKEQSRKRIKKSSSIPTTTLRSNITKATDIEKNIKTQDISKITCYSCNKIG